jgi:hypothetical protein
VKRTILRAAFPLSSYCQLWGWAWFYHCHPEILNPNVSCWYAFPCATTTFFCVAISCLGSAFAWIEMP